MVTSDKLAALLRWLVYISAIVPLVIFSQFISPFHFGKVVVFRSIVEIMFAVYLLLIWRDRSYLPRTGPIFWAFFSFVVAFTIATLTSVIPYMSLWGTLERMGGLLTFWHYFVFFMILTSAFRREEDWMLLFNLTIFVGILSAFYGFLQRTDASFIIGSGNRSRIFGTIGNPALFAGYQLFSLFLALTFYFRPKLTSNEKILYVSAIIFNTIAVLMTAVRGSIMGLGLGFLAYALLYSSAHHSKTGRKVLMGLFGLMILFITFGLLFKDTEFVKNSGYLTRLTDFSLKTYTVQTRFWAWEAGFKGWAENLKTIIFGWGPENFNIPFSKYFNPKFFRGIGSETLFDRAHNQFIEILVTMGLLGFLTYVSIYFFSFKALWAKINDPKYRHYVIGLIPLLIAYIIHNSFIFDTSANFYVFFLIIGFIFFLSSESGKNVANGKPTGKRINEGLWFSAVLVLAILTPVFIYFINIRPSNVNYMVTRAILKGWDGNFNAAVEQFKQAVNYDVPGKYEYRNRFAQYVLEYSNSREITPEIETALNEAIVHVQKNVDENKQDYLPYLYMSRLYISLGKADPQSSDNDKALEYSLKALDLSQTFVRTYYEIGQTYLNKKDLDKAAQYFRKAAELNPEVGLSKWYLGVVEVERGNVAAGLKIIEEAILSGAYSPSESDLNRLLSIYINLNSVNGIQWALENLVTARPDNPQYHASLATLYAQIGRTDDAVKQAKEAANLDASFEAEARAFVQSLGRTW